MSGAKGLKCFTIIFGPTRRWDTNQLGLFCAVGLLRNGTEAMENRFGLSDLVTLVLAGVILGVLSAFVRDWWQAGLIVFDPQLISEKLVAFGKAYF